MTAQLHDTFPLSNWAAMDRFLVRCYGERYVLREQALMHWQYGLSPDDLGVFWYGTEDEVISILGYRATPMFWGDTQKPVRAAWVTNWMTDPAHRSGVGAALMRRAQELFPVVLAQGASAFNKPIAERLGFRILEPIGRMIAVFDASRTRTFLAEGELPAEVSIKDQAFQSSPYAPDWTKYPSCMNFTTIRDQAFLEWRYRLHPVFDYRVLTLGSALCVWRMETSRGDVEHKVGRIVELIHADGDRSSGETVLRAALGQIRAEGAAFADFLCSAKVFRDTAAGTGMTDATHLPLAFRLSPVEKRLRRQNVEFWADSGLPQPPELDFWYVTKADGDQDRPNHP